MQYRRSHGVSLVAAFQGLSLAVQVGVLSVLLYASWLIFLGDPINLISAFVFARVPPMAGGAHILSFLPLPIMGLLISGRLYRQSRLSALEAVLCIGFLVAVHDIVWITALYAYKEVVFGVDILPFLNIWDGLYVAACVIGIIIYWKMPGRVTELKVWAPTLVFYASYMIGWMSLGFPISTFGFLPTALFWSLETNLIEILSWMVPAVIITVSILVFAPKNRSDQSSGR